MFLKIDDRGLIKRFIIIILVLIFIGLGILVWIRKKNPKIQTTNDGLISKLIQEIDEEGAKKSNFLKLFFASKDLSSLVAEKREIKEKGVDINQQIDQAINELIKGPRGDLERTIPDGTSLRGFCLDQDGIGYIDLSSEIIQNHPKGSWGEILTVYSIVNTITQNFPHVNKIRLLVNGMEVETLSGHLDLQRTFSYNEFISHP